MRARNAILDKKLSSYGRKIILKGFDVDSYESFSCPPYANVSPLCVSPESQSIDLDENDFQVLPSVIISAFLPVTFGNCSEPCFNFQEFGPGIKKFDVHDLEQLVSILKNPFSSVNVASENGLCIAFVCPQVCGANFWLVTSCQAD